MKHDASFGDHQAKKGGFEKMARSDSERQVDYMWTKRCKQVFQGDNCRRQESGTEPAATGQNTHMNGIIARDHEALAFLNNSTGNWIPNHSFQRCSRALDMF